MTIEGLYGKAAPRSGCSRGLCTTKYDFAMISLVFVLLFDFFDTGDEPHGHPFGLQAKTNHTVQTQFCYAGPGIQDKVNAAYFSLLPDRLKFISLERIDLIMRSIIDGKQAVIAFMELQEQDIAIHVCISYLGIRSKSQAIGFTKVSHLGLFRS